MLSVTSTLLYNHPLPRACWCCWWFLHARVPVVHHEMMIAS